MPDPEPVPGPPPPVDPAAPPAPPSAPSPTSPDPRRAAVERATTAWIDQLIDVGAGNRLLYYRDLQVGTLDLDPPASEAVVDAPDEPDAPGDASGRARDWFGNPIEHGRDDPVPCPFCGAGFDRLAAYEAHLQGAHNFRSAAPVRKEYTPNALLRAIGSLRFIPAWFVGLVAFTMWKVLGFSYFVGAISFLLLVMWTQTAKMFKRR